MEIKYNIGTITEAAGFSEQSKNSDTMNLLKIVPHASMVEDAKRGVCGKCRDANGLTERCPYGHYCSTVGSVIVRAVAALEKQA